MNSITDLLDLEDGDLCITETQIQGQTKTITIETKPVAHYCPNCGYRMYSRGVKKRKVNHPILQDNYSLIIILKQRRWRCTNPECLYDISENFKFVNKRRRTSNATDMLIVDAYRNLKDIHRISYYQHYGVFVDFSLFLIGIYQHHLRKKSAFHDCKRHDGLL